MKKHYITPRVRNINLDTASLVAGSLTTMDVKDGAVNSTDDVWSNQMTPSHSIWGEQMASPGSVWGDK